jgi:hypothetical protein
MISDFFCEGIEMAFSFDNTEVVVERCCMIGANQEYRFELTPFHIIQQNSHMALSNPCQK